MFCFSAGGDGVPWSFVSFQALNFFVFLTLLIILIKKPAPKILAEKQKSFLDYRKKAIAEELEIKNTCLALEKEVKKLEQKDVSKEAESALEKLKIQKTKEYEQWFTDAKIQFASTHTQTLKKESFLLKEALIKQTMKNTRQKLELWKTKADQSQKEQINKEILHKIKERKK